MMPKCIRNLVGEFLMPSVETVRVRFESVMQQLLADELSDDYWGRVDDGVDDAIDRMYYAEPTDDDLINQYNEECEAEDYHKFLARLDIKFAFDAGVIDYGPQLIKQWFTDTDEYGEMMYYDLVKVW